MGKQVRYAVCEIKWMSGMKLMQILEITLYTYNQGHIDVIQYTNIIKWWFWHPSRHLKHI